MGVQVNIMRVQKIMDLKSLHLQKKKEQIEILQDEWRHSDSVMPSWFKV